MICEKIINIDLAHPFLSDILRFHEGDVNGYDIKLNIYNDGVAFDLTGCSAEYDAVIGQYLAEFEEPGSVSGSTVTIPVTGAMTAYPGNLKIDVRIIKDEEILFFQTIRAYVQARAVDDSIVTPEGERIADFLTRMEEDLEYLDTEVVGKMDLAPNGYPANTAERGQMYYKDDCLGVKTSAAGSQSQPTYKEAYTKEASDGRYIQLGRAVKIADAYTNPAAGQLSINDATAPDTLYLYRNPSGTVIGSLRCCGTVSDQLTKMQIRMIGGFAQSTEVSYRLIDFSTTPATYGSWTKFATMSDIPDVSGKEDTSNKAAAITNDNKQSVAQYLSVKAAVDYIDGTLGNIETLLAQI